VELEDSISGQMAGDLQPAGLPSNVPDELVSSAADPALTEDLAIALLKRSDLAPEALEAISKNPNVSTNRKVRIALISHPKTPRHASLPLIRLLFTFDLMQVALTPITPADVKVAIEEVLINKLQTISTGERLTLARCASGRVAGALLLDSEPRVIHAALENGRLTEAPIIKAVLRYNAPDALVQAVCHHAKWSYRREIRTALLRNEKTPLARALEFARSLPPGLVREILQASRLPMNVKTHILRDLKN
jgi:hypothetical protein